MMLTRRALSQPIIWQRFVQSEIRKATEFANIECMWYNEYQKRLGLEYAPNKFVYPDHVAEHTSIMPPGGKNMNDRLPFFTLWDSKYYSKYYLDQVNANNDFEKMQQAYIGLTNKIQKERDKSCVIKMGFVLPKNSKALKQLKHYLDQTHIDINKNDVFITGSIYNTIIDVQRSTRAEIVGRPLDFL